MVAALDVMKTAVVKKTIAGACVVLAALSARSSSDAQDASGPRDDAEGTQVEELYARRCARCHGRDGRGKTKLGEMVKAPDFTDGNWWAGGVSDARLRASIHGGKGEMPGFGKKLTRPEISSLAAYVRAFAPGRRAKR